MIKNKITTKVSRNDPLTNTPTRVPNPDPLDTIGLSSYIPFLDSD